VGLWYAIKQHAYVGALSNWLDGNDLLSGMAVGVGGSGGGGGLVAILGGGSCVGGAVVAILLALGALFRAPNNLPMVSHLGLCLWLPALLLDLPWVFFLSMSFLGAALQVAEVEVEVEGVCSCYVHSLFCLRVEFDS
jgi:hypothetical protein